MMLHTFQEDSILASLMPEEKYIEDYIHNLGFASHGLATALCSMRQMTTDDMQKHFEDNPVLPSVMRIARRDTTLGGIFPEDEPLIAQQSVIILKIGDAATEAQDDRFLFGSSLESRECPLKACFSAL